MDVRRMIRKNMKKRVLIFIFFAWCGIISARYLQSPLSLYRGYLHYPMDRNADIENEYGLILNIWGAGYCRSAIDAYGTKLCKDRNSSCSSSSNCNRTSSNNNNSSSCNASVNSSNMTNAVCPVPDVPSSLQCGVTSSNRIELTQLFFGKSDFRLAESFAGAVVSPGSERNPFVTVSTLSPRYEWNEKGAFFGMNVGKRFGCDDRWQAGMRARLPYRDIEIEQSCGLDLTGETLQDLYQVRSETITVDNSPPVTNPQVFAARLDFLSTLNRIAFNSSGATEKLVKYVDTTNGNELTIGGQKASGGLSSNTVTDTAPFIAAIRRIDGSIPINDRWADFPQIAPIIGAGGTGLSNDGRGRFVNDISYASLGNDVNAQSQLWIVPNVEGGGGTTPGLLIPASNTVKSEIDNSIAALDPSVTTFLKNNGIEFCNGGRNKGLGDLDLEWFVGYQRCENYWGELSFGLRLPTGKRLTNPLSLVRQPLGNNGHVELRPGLILGCERWERMKFKFDLTYSFVLKRLEYLPAAFAGATIINVGPLAQGNVSWNYFLGSFEMTHIHPRNNCLGWTLAYEVYVKQKDKVKFCDTQVKDFNGNLQTLDANLLRCFTDRTSHKLKGELFFSGICCNIFAGFNQVIAGKNITRDTDMYIGLNVNF